MNDANYRKHNDRTLNSSTYHKKDGTPVRSILKQESEKEIQEGLSERIPWNAVVRVTPSDDLSPEQEILLEEVVAQGVYPDLDGYWDGESWILSQMSIIRDPNWELHRSCIERAGGIFEIID